MQKYLFRILNYFAWTIVAFLIAFIYMRIILGAKPESTEGFMIVFDLIYQHAFLYIGLVVGSIIALLFILIDIFYLQNRLDNTARSTIIRLLTLIGIAMLVGITHYVLEKVVDII